MFSILAGSAVVPSLLLILFFHRKDANPEPARVVWATFGLGVLTIPFVLLMVWPLEALFHIDDMTEPVSAGFAQAFLHAAIPEEVLKFCVLYFYAQRHKEFDEPMDGIVYGAVASLGFATLENILYVGQGGLGVAVLRAMTAVPGHAFTGAIMGYYVGQAKFFPTRRVPMLSLALIVPILLHGLYDFPLLAMGVFQENAAKGAETPGHLAALLPLTLLALGLEIGLSLRAIKHLRKSQLQDNATARGEHPELMYLQPNSGSAAVGWLFSLAGGLLASFGGLCLFGLWIATSFGAGGTESAGVMVFMGVVGLVLSTVGMALFFSGRNRVHRNQMARRGVPVSRR